MAKDNVMQMQGKARSWKIFPVRRSGLIWRMNTQCLGISPENTQEPYQDPPADKVAVEMTPYDLTKARIVFRSK